MESSITIYGANIGLPVKTHEIEPLVEPVPTPDNPVEDPVEVPGEEVPVERAW